MFQTWWYVTTDQHIMSGEYTNEGHGQAECSPSHLFQTIWVLLIFSTTSRKKGYCYNIFRFYEKSFASKCFVCEQLPLDLVAHLENRYLLLSLKKLAVSEVFLKRENDNHGGCWYVTTVQHIMSTKYTNEGHGRVDFFTNTKGEKRYQSQ